MTEDELREAMIKLQRDAAKSGRQRRTPKDKKRPGWLEPLSEFELELLSLMRERYAWEAADLAGAMDETFKDMMPRLLHLIDRGYVTVVHDGKGYARYRAKRRDDLRKDIDQVKPDTERARDRVWGRAAKSRKRSTKVERRTKPTSLF